MQPEARRALRERVPRDSSTAITARDVVDTHFKYPWHYHPEAELLLVVQGRGLRYIGDSIGEFEPGELCLIAGGTPHCWASQPAAGASIRALVIQFPHEVFGADFLTLDATRPIGALLQRAQLGLRVVGPTLQQVSSDMWRLMDPSVSELEKMLELFSMLTEMSTSPHCQALALSSSGCPVSEKDVTRAGKLLRYIHDHASERLSQRDVAKLVGMSPGAFSRFFSRQFGKPFVTYVAEVRIGHACRLLMESDMNVSEVAFQAGFNNLANFNRQFLRLKGMTPTAYRRKLRALGGSVDGVE